VTKVFLQRGGVIYDKFNGIIWPHV